MTKKEFVKRVAKEKKDLLQEFTRILKEKKIPFIDADKRSIALIPEDIKNKLVF